ncbi:hypothetical protein L218DRAFT_961845, partial [Marasmius fiardii PR-910]
IIRSRLQARRDRLQVNTTVPTALESVAENPIKPRKKALLIGVQYLTMGENALQGPHRDVAVMKRLLIEKYGYHVKDIVTLVDTKDCKQKQPTHDNMIEEMQNLVNGATAGDRFFFHYSGHATQVHNKDNKEEDGMDECIIPCDCVGSPEDPKLIKDDVLKKILVDSLPTGSHLVAIFDSCHSASLLDLKHFRCNRVYVPWMSKGRRRSDSMWYANVRKNAALVNTRTIHQTSRMSNNVVKTRKTSLDLLSEQPQPLPSTPASHLVDFTQESSSSTSASSRPQSPTTTTRAVSPQNTTSMAKTRRRQSTSTIRSNFTPWFEDRPGQEDPMCESPVEEYCTGRCRSMPSPIMGRRPTFGSGKSPISVRQPVDALPDVISLGSCKDSQSAWEDLDGTSMTQSLVEILSKDPHPTLKDFMAKLNHTLHDRLMRMHETNLKYKKDRKWWRIKKGKKAPPEGDTKGQLEFNNFQDPQISSHKPLDMDSRLEF